MLEVLYLWMAAAVTLMALCCDGNNNVTARLRRFEVPRLRSVATANFEHPFTPRTWLRSARNLGNAGFGRFATFDFSSPKNFSSKIFGMKSQIFVNLVRFWSTYSRMDVEISFLVKFCSR